MKAAGPVFHRHLDGADDELMQLLQQLVTLQRRAASGVTIETAPDASEAVSKEALQDLFESGTQVSDIRADPGISRCLVFNTSGLEGAVDAPEVVEMRQSVDRLVAQRLSTIGASARTSGHFLYPAGGHMAWHTNDRVPGWRMYITNADEPGASFFRYRDPADGEIVTSWDTGWDLRVFRIDPATPLWHAVHAQTDRTSLGYRIESDVEMSADAIARAACPRLSGS